jgi:hypothetical protein
VLSAHCQPYLNFSLPLSMCVTEKSSHFSDLLYVLLVKSQLKLHQNKKFVKNKMFIYVLIVIEAKKKYEKKALTSSKKPLKMVKKRFFCKNTPRKKLHRSFIYGPILLFFFLLALK